MPKPDAAGGVHAGGAPPDSELSSATHVAIETERRVRNYRRSHRPTAKIVSAMLVGDGGGAGWQAPLSPWGGHADDGTPLISISTPAGFPPPPIQPLMSSRDGWDGTLFRPVSEASGLGSEDLVPPGYTLGEAGLVLEGEGSNSHTADLA